MKKAGLMRRYVALTVRDGKPLMVGRGIYLWCRFRSRLFNSLYPHGKVMIFPADMTREELIGAAEHINSLRERNIT